MDGEMKSTCRGNWNPFANLFGGPHLVLGEEAKEAELADIPQRKLGVKAEQEQQRALRLPQL